MTEMNAGYTGGDIDLLRIHSRDDMDKCKIYTAVDRGGGRGVVCGYTVGKKRDELGLSYSSQEENPCRVVKTDSSTHAGTQHSLGWGLSSKV